MVWPQKACRSCVSPVVASKRRTIDLIKRVYLERREPWFLGFSGGKDSSALLILTYAALKDVGDSERPVTVIYCDTGVEIPVVSALVRTAMSALQTEAEADGVPLRVRVAEPATLDRYFVKVIGRGYPTPTNKFRWCTDRLRIGPVQKLIREEPGPSTVLLGVRAGESLDRDRTLARHTLDEAHFLRQSGHPDSTIFAPIIDYSVGEVWGTLHHERKPVAIDSQRLAALYKSAGGDCPIVRDPRGSPCGKGRFGCWTCTVVRKDAAVSGMVAEGHPELAPLLRFRNWLAQYRDDPAARAARRRNGAPGPGPFTLRAREEILRRLIATQTAVPWTLIRDEELQAIEQLWEVDRATGWA
jgi:DNA sulfur modification protein DndC